MHCMFIISCYYIVTVGCPLMPFFVSCFLFQALKYVSFPVQTLAKCAKMIPVMVRETLIPYSII